MANMTKQKVAKWKLQAIMQSPVRSNGPWPGRRREMGSREDTTGVLEHCIIYMHHM